jgi:hypothetical protein
MRKWLKKVFFYLKGESEMEIAIKAIIRPFYLIVALYKTCQFSSSTIYANFHHHHHHKQ